MAQKSTSSENASSPRMDAQRESRAPFQIQSDANSGITGVNYRSLPDPGSAHVIPDTNLIQIAD